MRRIPRLVHQDRRKRLRISSKDRILFSKRLSLYLHAGISIIDAMSLMRATPGSRNHAWLLKQLMHDMQEGLSLSASLSRFPRAYAPADIQLIAVGEQTGTLSRSLSGLATTLEERAARIRSVVGALAYPLVLLIGSMTVSVFLIAYAFPKIVPLFRGLHATLPFTTRALLAASSFLQQHGLLLACSLIALAAAVYRSLQVTWIKYRIQRATLRIPFIGTLLKAGSLVSIFQTASILLSSGVRLDEAIHMAQGSVSSIPYRLSLERARRAVLSGDKLSTVLSTQPVLFPPVAIQLISVGEMTGTLSQNLGSAADIFKTELSDGLRTLSSVLEPLIMVGMGLVIGFIAMAIISPMYGITQSLST